MPQKEGGTAQAARRGERKRPAGMGVRRQREFAYRGFTLDELKAMPMEEVISLLPSRARRTFLRGIDDERTAFLEKIKTNGTDEAGETEARDLPILPWFGGKKG